jgi:hypothetical protein
VMLCRTRLVDLATRRVESFGPTGPVIGLAWDGALIALAPCGGDPCAIVRHEAGGAFRILAESAGAAAMAGGRVVFATPSGGLAALDPVGGDMEVVDDASGARPLGESSASLAGVTHARDSVVLADGRVDARSLRVLPAGSHSPIAIGEVVP